MKSPRSLPDRLRRYETLIHRMGNDLDLLPQARDAHAQLTGLVNDIKGRSDQEAILRGQAKKSMANRDLLERAARSVRLTLVTILRAHYGPNNEQLLEYDVPIGRPGRKAKAIAAKAVVDGGSTPPSSTEPSAPAAPTA